MDQEQQLQVRFIALEASIKSFLGLAEHLHNVPTTEDIVARAKAFEVYVNTDTK